MYIMRIFNSRGSSSVAVIQRPMPSTELLAILQKTMSDPHLEWDPSFEIADLKGIWVKFTNLELWMYILRIAKWNMYHSCESRIYFFVGCMGVTVFAGCCQILYLQIFVRFMVVVMHVSMFGIWVMDSVYFCHRRSVLSCLCKLCPYPKI